MAALILDPEELRPLVETIVSEVIRQREAKYGSRLAFTEREVAQILGMHPNQLAAERKVGRIKSATVGERGIRYSRKHIEQTPPLQVLHAEYPLPGLAQLHGDGALPQVPATGRVVLRACARDALAETVRCDAGPNPTKARER